MADPSHASKPGASPATPSDRRIWLDGELVPWERATVHVLSHSLQRGSLIFDYLSVHETPRGPAIFRLRDHVERLLRSAELVGLPLGRSLEEIEAATLETLRANPGASAVKISAYLPSIEVDVVPLDDRVAVAIAAYDPWRDVIQPKGIVPKASALLSLWIEKEVANRRKDIVPPQAKVAANYVAAMGAKWRARREGYDEILLLDERGCVAEGPTTNIFAVDAEGGLRTPRAEHVLLGVTRSSILELAKHEGIPVRECDLTPEELFEAAEVFLTGTTAGVWPVARVDGRKIGGEGSDPPGPVSRRLRDRFREVVSGADPAFLHWLRFADEAREADPTDGA